MSISILAGAICTRPMYALFRSWAVLWGFASVQRYLEPRKSLVVVFLEVQGIEEQSQCRGNIPSVSQRTTSLSGDGCEDYREHVLRS